MICFDESGRKIKLMQSKRIIKNGIAIVTPVSYTHLPQSGIWKTVWMESVEKAYIEDVRITPLYDDSSVRFEITVLNACKTSGAETSGGKASGGETSGTVNLAVLDRGGEIGQAEITVRQEKEIKPVS